MVSEALAGLGPLDVCLLDPWPSDDLVADWPAYVRDAECYPVSLQRQWALRVAAGWASPVREARLAPGIARAARARFFAPAPDLTWCVEARGYEPVAALVSSPVVLDLHNLHSSMVAHKRALLRRRPWDRQLWGTNGGVPYLPGLERAWGSWQRRASERCDEVVVCSEIDRVRLGAANATTIPNSYPRPEHPAGLERKASGPLRVGFVGLLEYQPNADGVAWFAREIWPRIRRAEPDAEFLVIGRGSESVARAVGQPGVRGLGFVADLAEHLKELDVLAAPLRFGGGTRFKILEAFAHRIPIVSTVIGAEGIDARDGVHLVLRDRPAGFADAVVRVYRDRPFRQRLVAEAAQLYEDRYTWDKGVAAVREVAGRLLEPESARAARRDRAVR
jgi:glycosyltransferase involved in cell wall biosynthesis